MDTKDLRSRILKKRPRYSSDKLEILDAISYKTSNKGNHQELGPYYKGYLYAFFLGYNLGKRLPLPDVASELNNFSYSIGEWSSLPHGFMDYVLMVLLTETKQDWFELENSEEEAINTFVRDLIDIFEQYANAGLAHLDERYNRDKYAFDNPEIFSDVLLEVAENSKQE